MIGILGAGNIGIALSCELSLRGLKNRLYTTRSDNKPKKIVLEEDDLVKYSCTIELLTDFSTVSDCSMLIVTYPSHFFKKIHNKIKPYVLDGTKIIIVPGSGGVEYVFRDFLPHSTIIGLQRVPAVYRIKGDVATVRGRRPSLLYSAIPVSRVNESKELLENIFNMRCDPLPNYLNVTLTPSNQLLHTSRLFALFGKNDPFHEYDSNPLFYGDWDDHSSEIILNCDDELTKIKIAIKEMNLAGISTLREHYESNDVSTFTAKIRSIASLHNIRSPMLKKGSKYILDWDSRYFASDFPNGIVIVKAIAIIFSVETPTIDSIINWYQSCTGKRYICNNNEFGDDICECNIPQNYGIHNSREFYKYYLDICDN